MLEFYYYSAQTVSVKFWTRVDETVQVGTAGGYSATASSTVGNLYKVDPSIGSVPAGDYYVTIEQSGGQSGVFVARRVDSDNWLTGDSFNSLELNAVSSLSVNVSVLPFSYDTEQRVQDQLINILYMEQIPVTVYINDSSGALDLTTKTLKFVVESTSKTDLLTILDADITRTANTFTVTVTTAISATVGTYWWSLRNLTSGEIVLAHGKLDVSYVARAA